MLDRGIELVYTEDLDALNPHNLARYPVILLYGNHPALSPEQEKALIGFVESGGGLVALHSASAMFTNSSAYIALIGAEFAHHGEGTVSTHVAEPEHPAMAGFEPFTSWDETYVHRRHNLQGRTVLEYRGSEPWTWVREQGDGRVFYTAWGHDHRTWRQPGFHDLVSAGHPLGRLSRSLRHIPSRVAVSLRGGLRALLSAARQAPWRQVGEHATPPSA